MHRTEAQTRSLVAEAVISYVTHHGIGVVPDFPMERILEAAGVSRASAYRIWPGREVFSAFALEQCAAGHAVATLGVRRALVLADTALLAGGDRVRNAASFVARAADEELTLLLRSEHWRAFIRFQAVVAQTRSPDVSAMLNRIDAEDTARLTVFYRGVAKAWGLEPVIDGGIAAIAEAALLIARSTVARVVAGGEEPAARAVYLATLSALIRGSFRALPNARIDREWVAGAIVEVAGTADVDSP